MSADKKLRDHGPAFVVIRGKAGSGKSTLAQSIARQPGYIRVDYDAEMARAYHRYGVGTEEVRDLARQEGRIAAGRLARSHLAEGRSVVCDADVRDSRELSDLTSYGGSPPPNVRLVVLRLGISREEARRRKVTPEWNEFRLSPGTARRFFEVMWNYPFTRVEGERPIDVEEKSPEQCLGEALQVIAPSEA